MRVPVQNFVSERATPLVIAPFASRGLAYTPARQ